MHSEVNDRAELSTFFQFVLHLPSYQALNTVTMEKYGKGLHSCLSLDQVQ